MNRFPDPRKPSQCLYTQAHLLWSGILLFLMHMRSRRQMRFERLAETFPRNLARLSGQHTVDTVADPDTLAYYAQRLSVEAADQLLANLTRRLIRMKALDPFRLKDHFCVAIDGSQISAFDSEPWPGCLRRTRSNGAIQYVAYTLDAKLVASSGMTLTLATVLLTNEGKTEFDKQDCERKAFERLSEKLHALFPRTPMCLLLDSLYADQGIIRLIEQKKWKYIITFKEGKMPERFREAETLARLQPKNRLQVRLPKGEQQYQWVQGLPIAEFNPNVLFCHDINDHGEAKRFVWLTNFHLCSNNIANIANQGGRIRWKIENEGFNVQKNNGYEMQHPYSKHVNGFRIFYILLLIAHYISQLILHGNLILSLRSSFGSARNFARRLAESMRNHSVTADLAMPGQIRFQPP